MTQPDFDVSEAHRYFAVQSNNLAWDLVEAERRSDDEYEQMIHAAHTALYHWSLVGSPLHRQRGLCLLATACAVAGRPSEARHYAVECVTMSQQNPEGQTTFDRAAAYGCAALAAGVNGDSAEAKRMHERAREEASRCDDHDEQRLISKLYPGP